VTGLRARGGFVVDLSWKAGQLESAKIQSLNGGRIPVRCNDRAIELEFKPGGEVRLAGPGLERVI
jgi:alpha-L-fucosidase 2